MDREAWNQRYADAELVWSAEANRFLVQEVAALRPGRALDLGAGEGRNAIWLSERGWRVTAVDFSNIGLQKARRLAEARGVEVDWTEADLRSYSPARRAFDLVVLVYIHLPGEERRALVRRAADAVAAGGTLIVIGHDRSNIEEGYGGPQDPAILFSPDDISDDLAGIEGLRVVRADRVMRPVMTDDGERNAIDALVRAERRTTRRRCTEISRMSTTDAFGFSVDVPIAYAEANSRVRELLKAEGFGVLTEIDVRATLREKLDVAFPRYEILGACNPPLAHRALQADPDVGLLLPCNVVVAERAEGGSRVSFMDPIAILGLVDNPALAPIAADAAERLRRVAAALER